MGENRRACSEVVSRSAHIQGIDDIGSCNPWTDETQVFQQATSAKEVGDRSRVCNSSDHAGLLFKESFASGIDPGRLWKLERY